MIELKKITFEREPSPEPIRKRKYQVWVGCPFESFGDRLSKKSESAKGCSRESRDEVCNWKKHATFSIKILRTHILTTVPKVLH